MNLCILFGKIISDIEFKFIINGKNKSIAYFDMELSNSSIIRVNAFDAKADFVYRKFKKGKYICIKGKIKSDGDIEYEKCTRSIFHKKELVQNYVKKLIPFSEISFLILLYN